MRHCRLSQIGRATRQRGSGSDRLVRFPARHASCIWILREDAAWLVVAGSHSWVHGDYHAAHADARWLAQNFGGLPIRSVA
jgi:hypothetical protein